MGGSFGTLHRHLLVFSPNTSTDSKLCRPPSSKDHIKPLFRTLYWLPIRSRSTYKLYTLYHKCIINLANEYLCSCLHLYTPSRTLRSSSDTLTLKIPRTKLSPAGQRAFTSAGPSTWNQLPLTLRQIPIHDSFKRQLKTHLFKYCNLQQLCVVCVCASLHRNGLRPITN